MSDTLEHADILTRPIVDDIDDIDNHLDGCQCPDCNPDSRHDRLTAA